MKKEYHYTISRTDRIYLVSFVIMLLGWELIKQFFPSGEHAFSYIAPTAEHKGFAAKKNFSYAHHEYSKKNIYSHARNFEHQYSSYQEEQEASSPSTPTMIRNASFEDLTSMGFTRKVAGNIQKFISAGGRIPNETSLMKIYGMDSVQLAKASPYIIYDTLTTYVNDKSEPENKLTVKATSKIVDLNIATQDQLESLDGIGSFLAERIIKFRDRIGGFINSAQLKECYGITPETYEKIKDQVTISGSPQLIYINDDNLDSLKHPYLNKKLIRLIKAYKKQHGYFTDAGTFRKVYPADSTWCNKILPYLSFGTKENDKF